MEQCRLCLTQNFQNNLTVTSDRELLNKIKECVSIEITVHDCYTKAVCEMCIHKVNNWFEFKTMCLMSSRVLENRYKNGQDCGNIENITTLNNVLKLAEEKNVDLHDETDAQVDNYMEQMEEGYKCEFCDKKFIYYTDYLDHQEEHEGEPIFNCDKCSELFSSKKQLIIHEKAHKIKCKYCGIEVQKQSMRGHLNKHTEKFKCPECWTCFNSRAMLQDHVVSIHTKVKNHVCEVCAKVFSTKSSLSMHLKTHNIEKGYKCKDCDYAARTSAALYIHMSKHANEVHICEYCSKIFKSNRNLNDHLKRVHCNVKNHWCTYCSKRFALRYQLETHIRIHTGVHPYRCQKCPKTFARSDNLKEHINTHERSVFYDCSKCSKRFLTRKGLKKHNCKT